MDLSKQIDNKLDCENLKKQVNEMSGKLKKLKNKRDWSKAAIVTGESILLASLIAIPVLGLVTGLTVLGVGAAFYGTGRIVDRKIVNNYNETSEELGLKSRELLDKEFENRKETEKETGKSSNKVETKTVETKKTVDEGKEI